jgi:hypothetical protein
MESDASNPGNARKRNSAVTCPRHLDFLLILVNAAVFIDPISSPQMSVSVT